MGHVSVEVGFVGMQCSGCDYESMDNIESMGGDYCELFSVSKGVGTRCAQCLESELRTPEDL